MTDPERQPCGTCGEKYTVTAAGGMRSHFTENPDFQAGPDSRKCKGTGEPPAVTAPVTGASQCRLCRHPVQLLDNGRVRRHLTPEQTPRLCPAGSDFPLGAYPDMVGTTDGLVATLAFDCEHREAGACYDCHAAQEGNAKSRVGDGQPTLAEQFTAAPLTKTLERETADAGTVLTVMDGTMAEQFAGGLSAPDPRTLPEGLDPTCNRCQTNGHQCPGCGEDIRHGLGACDECNARVEREKLPDDWRTPVDLLEQMPERIRGLDALRLDCTTCGHPVTPLAESFDLYGAPKTVVWLCEPAGLGGAMSCDRKHECEPDVRVRIGELADGDHFLRRGFVMRVTGGVNGVVHAVVVGGPHAGQTGELSNPDEQVERVPVPAVLPQPDPVTPSAPTATAGTSGGSTAGMTTDQQATAAAQFLAGSSGAHGEPETKRDRFGRYLIPHPGTGEEQAWTRATTFAKSISDTYALGQWGLRMALLGATMRPDIVKRAHGKHVSADKQLLDELTAELKSAAGDKVAANLGTAMHSFTELADRAWHSPGGPRSALEQVPPDCRAEVETYIRLLEETGLEPVPHLIEFTTVVEQYGVAGTSDNCYQATRPVVLKIGRREMRLEPGEYVIGDKKTGKSLDYGWQEIAIQLAVYAQGLSTSGVWDRKNERWAPDPLDGATLRTDAGIVVHLPVDGTSKKQPAVYGVDLDSGWNAAVLCERVRAWRKVRSLSGPVMVSQPPEPVISQTSVRPPTLREKAAAVTSKGEASAVWREARKSGMSDADTDALVALMQVRLQKLAEPGG